jgi:alanine dehydrogenase
VRPVARAVAYDPRSAASAAFARSAAETLGILVHVADDLERATSAAEIIVTCTTSRRAFLGARHVSPGAFVAAVGADAEDKAEVEPALMAASAVVVDSREQCATIGDLHHALTAGVMEPANVRAELADVVVDPARGRRSRDEVVIFDSTGVAFEDVAAAAVVYERAVRDGGGLVIDLAG